MSRKSVLIAKLTEDEVIKDAFRQFAAKIVSTSKLSSFPLENYMQSALSSSSEGEESDEELCECQCRQSHKIKHKAVVKEITNEDINGINIKDIHMSQKCCQKDQNDINSIVDNFNINTNTNTQSINNFNVNNDNNNNNNHSESCECIGCEKIKKSNENANKLIADEERKKKKSEKKKLQKKKKRDKRKAEKQTAVDSDKAINSLETNLNEGFNISRKDSKVNKNIINNNNNNNNNKNKNETKKKNLNFESNKQNVKQMIDSKEVEKTNTNRESEKVSSNKSSPKSERENDVSINDVEEEELSFSSAYVSQIAQRKSKPSKTAQMPSETQDYIHSDDNLKNSSNNYINSINSNNNNNNNNSLNSMKPIKEVNEEMPKTKVLGEHKQKPLKVSKENKLQNIDKSIELAILANQKAEALRFNEAIDLFSQALVYNPQDYRFYVNRSYCFDSIQDYRSALRDAEIAIQLRSDWPKCHYRKGKALAGLKNYHEAEIALKKVISIEKDCDEALTELWHVRYGAIVDMGYDASAANIYASQCDTIKDALDALSIKSIKNSKTPYSNNKSLISNQSLKRPINNSFNSSANITKNDFSSDNYFDLKSSQIWADDDIYISDDEYNAVRDVDFSFEETSPTNPFGWKALWVGNVSLNAKLDTVTTMFGKFGNLNYCNIFKGNNGGNFILVHYDNPDSPRLAMTKYQGKVVPGVSISETALTIRFRPNKDQKKPNYDQRLESDECYYWRTTGCARGDKCLYKHIGANKGVDKQAWMCNPLKKGLPLNNGKTQKQ